MSVSIAYYNSCLILPDAFLATDFSVIQERYQVLKAQKSVTIAMKINLKQSNSLLPFLSFCLA